MVSDLCHAADVNPGSCICDGTAGCTGNGRGSYRGIQGNSNRSSNRAECDGADDNDRDGNRAEHTGRGDGNRHNRSCYRDYRRGSKRTGAGGRNSRADRGSTGADSEGSSDRRRAGCQESGETADEGKCQGSINLRYSTGRRILGRWIYLVYHVWWKETLYILYRSWYGDAFRGIHPDTGNRYVMGFR